MRQQTALAIFQAFTIATLLILAAKLAYDTYVFKQQMAAYDRWMDEHMDKMDRWLDEQDRKDRERLDWFDSHRRRQLED